MSLNPARHYADTLNGILKHEADFFRITEDTVTPPLWVLAYLDVPAPGHLTVFTWGLSEVVHPAWTVGRPELTLCLETRELDWALALGHLALAQRGVIPFATGTILDFGHPIATDSPMTGFFLHEPISFPAGTPYQLKLPDREIHLMGAFPLHSVEVDRCSLLGLESFFTGSPWDPYTVARAPRGS